MARMTKNIPQNYPRIDNENDPYYGCLDDTKLVQHHKQISPDELKTIISSAIRDANRKSSRAILSIDTDMVPHEIDALYERGGRELFAYFRKYCGDPASTAHQVYGSHYRKVGVELFRNRTLQKERMNSGWRYQFLAYGCAKKSGRFTSVSDLGTAEADFNVVVDFLEKKKGALNLYVSIKNRVNTMGGQDWPKAIQALETYARNDRNRRGPYCCVFGIAIDRGTRYIKREQRSGQAHSVNTEVWLSDFFWPFFANYSYAEIMTQVLDVLIENYAPDEPIMQIEIPNALLDSFGEKCFQAELTNQEGVFHDRHRLVRFFCEGVKGK